MRIVPNMLDLLVTLLILWGISIYQSSLESFNPWAPLTFTSDICPESVASAGVECSLIRVPSNWLNVVAGFPAVPTIQLFIRRYRQPHQTTAKHRAKMIFLAGGPGQEVSKGLFERLSVGYGVREVYLMDHRGSGYSTPLDCGRQLKTAKVSALECWKDMIDQVPNYRDFSVTNAAMDHLFLISQLKRDDDPTGLEVEPIFVHGVSYGGYLLRRLLDLAPAVNFGSFIDKVIIQSSFGDGFDVIDDGMIEGCRVVLQKYLDNCHQRSGHSCPFSYRTVGELREAIESSAINDDAEKNPCLMKLMPDSMENTREMMEILLIKSCRGAGAGDYDGRKLLVLLDRIIRCSDRGLTAAKELAEYFKTKINTGPHYGNLFHLISASELTPKSARLANYSQQQSVLHSNYVEQLIDINREIYSKGQLFNQVKNFHDYDSVVAAILGWQRQVSSIEATNTECLFIHGNLDFISISAGKNSFDSAKCKTKRFIIDMSVGHSLRVNNSCVRQFLNHKFSGWSSNDSRGLMLWQPYELPFSTETSLMDIWPSEGWFESAKAQRQWYYNWRAPI